MRCWGWVLAGLLGGGGAGLSAQIAPMAPPGILKEDCSRLKGKAKVQCDARNKAGDSAAAPAATPPNTSDMPTGADADVPGEPSTPRPAKAGTAKAVPDTSDMPKGTDADPPASSMGPLRPDGTPDTEAPRNAAAGSSSSSSSADDDAPPTTAGGDSPVKAATLKDMGSHADSSAARQKLEDNRVADDVKVGRFYLHDGNFSGAETRFRDALAHDPDDPEAHFAMAELLMKQKRNDEAAVQLKRYLELAPDDDHTKDAKKLLAKLGK